MNTSIRPESVRDLGRQEIRDILLISNPYHIYTIKTEAALKTAVSPTGPHRSGAPRITGVSSVDQAVQALEDNAFDLAVMAALPDKVNPYHLGPKLKAGRPKMPVALFLPGSPCRYHRLGSATKGGIDWTFDWSGDPEMLPAVVRLAEDRLNADRDTMAANARVILVIEDSPAYASWILPILHKKINHRPKADAPSLCRGKRAPGAPNARPKILLADTYESAMALYSQYQSSLVCVISDTRLPRAGREDASAGISILSQIRALHPEMPLLLMSSESANREKAPKIPAWFMDKNQAGLDRALHRFFCSTRTLKDFFPSPPGEKKMAQESIPGHSLGTDAGQTRQNPGNASGKQEIVEFDPDGFHAGTALISRIGQGAMGAKARGLAFMAQLLDTCPDIQGNHPGMDIRIPRTLVICADIFDQFLKDNHLARANQDCGCQGDEKQKILDTPLPPSLARKLEAYLGQVRVPLAVRPSSQMEENHPWACTGLYKTCMIPNSHPDPRVRLAQLAKAIKQVWASAFTQEARTFCRNTFGLPREDAMAVIIQELAGSHHGPFFYPALSGTAQSHNAYPFSPMTAKDGVAHMALGLGNALAQGDQHLRFCPRHPGILPHLSGARDFLDRCQTRFFALRTRDYPDQGGGHDCPGPECRHLADAIDEPPVKALASTYIAGEDRIRDTWHCPGPKVLGFAPVLKFQNPPIPGLIRDLLAHGEKGMGRPCEIEFAADLPDRDNQPWRFHLLQIRPLAADFKAIPLDDPADDRDASGPLVCTSSTALGHGRFDTIQDIVYVRPDNFKREKTPEMAQEISRINASLARENRRFLLAGPGRWGSSDPWLGIPVAWPDISGAGAIVELRTHGIHADPSHGAHFFHNLTAMGIPYITVNPPAAQALGTAPPKDWFSLRGLAGSRTDTRFLSHLRLDAPLRICINGKTGRCVIRAGQARARAA